MRWKFIHDWKTCLTSTTNNCSEEEKHKNLVQDIGPTSSSTSGAASSSVSAATTSSLSTNHSSSSNNSTIRASNISIEDETDLITISVSNNTLKRWSVGSTSNSEGDYSKVIVQFGNEFDINNTTIAPNIEQEELEPKIIQKLGYFTNSTIISVEKTKEEADVEANNISSIMKVPNINEKGQDKLINNTCNNTHGFDLLATCSSNNSTRIASSTTNNNFSQENFQIKKQTNNNKSSVSFSPQSTMINIDIGIEIESKASHINLQQNQLNIPIASQDSFDDDDYNYNNDNGDETTMIPTEQPMITTSYIQQLDKWKQLFNQFDYEGFGEILWIDFYNIALNSTEFKKAVEAGKLEILKDLAKERLEKISANNNNNNNDAGVNKISNAITFQHFVNIMSGKRSRSFKCAVHHRDREVSSENDFHIILPPIKSSKMTSTVDSSTNGHYNQNNNDDDEESVGYLDTFCTKDNCKQQERLARLISNEFLTDERDRKYYTEQYNCCPPPLFIPILTLIQVGSFLYYIIYHHLIIINNNSDGETAEDLENNDDNTYLIEFKSSSSPTTTYLYTPITSGFVYRPDKKAEIWRFLFYALLHAGWPHFIFNIIIQLIIGLPLEMIHGSLRILLLYVIGVIGGSLTTSIFDPHVNLIGGSGGVYTILTAHVANILINYNQKIKYGICKLGIIIITASLDVGLTIYNRYVVIYPSILPNDNPDEAMMKQELAPISYLSHITGVMIGLNVGLVILRNFEQNLHQQLIWWFSLTLFGVWTIFTILMNIYQTKDLIES